MIHWFDAVVALFLVVAVPLLAFLSERRFQRQLAAGDPGVRMTAYRTAILWQWAVTATVMLFWFAIGRSGGELGFLAPAGWGFWLGLGLATLAAAFLFGQEYNLRRAPEQRDEARRELGSLADFLPWNNRELRTFEVLSVTAGICEEIIYRGYLLWLLTPWLGSWIAVVASSLIFAAGHLDQGWRGMFRVLVAGLVLAGLYLLTGSLWVPMVLHAVADIAGGRFGRLVLEESKEQGQALPSAS